MLVVGGSATGVQLAAEIRRSGRPVMLSVGEHVRMPRTYRGRDVLWWMQASGVWDQRHDEVDDLERARALPSPQLVGTPERATLDLNTLISLGVEPVGRWAAVRDGEALFSGGLRNVCALADLKMERLLDTFDEWARISAGDIPEQEPERLAPTRLPDSVRLRLDLRSGEIQTVVWATGFRPDYRWLDVPVLDSKGRLRHVGGIVPDAPASTPSGCQYCGGASRRSSTGPRTTRGRSSTTWSATWGGSSVPHSQCSYIGFSIVRESSGVPPSCGDVLSRTTPFGGFSRLRVPGNRITCADWFQLMRTRCLT